MDLYARVISFRYSRFRISSRGRGQFMQALHGCHESNLSWRVTPVLDLNLVPFHLSSKLAVSGTSRRKCRLQLVVDASLHS